MSVAGFVIGGGACFGALEGIAFEVGIFLIFISFAPVVIQRKTKVGDCNFEKSCYSTVSNSQKREIQMSIQSATAQFDAALVEAKGNLENSKQAVTHWEGQVSKLTAAISALSSILTPDDFQPAPARGKAATKKPAGKAGPDVPKTDSAFWKSLLSEVPQNTKEILDAATTKLQVTDPEAISVLRARQTAYLQKSAAEHLIKSEGERLNRKYFV